MTYTGFRILASNDLIWKLGISGESRPLTSLSVDEHTDELPIEARAIAEQLVWLAKAGQWSAIQLQATNNPEFYSAFGWKTQKGTITSNGDFAKP